MKSKKPINEIKLSLHFFKSIKNISDPTKKGVVDLSSRLSKSTEIFCNSVLRGVDNCQEFFAGSWEFLGIYTNF
jgi:hypothetical protein